MIQTNAFIKVFPASLAAISFMFVPLHAGCSTAAMLDNHTETNVTGAIRPDRKQLGLLSGRLKAITPRRYGLAGDIPYSVDNSRSVYFPPIGDQGGLGSCVQWAEVYYACSYEFKRTTGLTNKAFAFSPKFTYNWLSDSATGGTWPMSGFNMALDHGALSMVRLPYNSDWRTVVTNWVDWADALSFAFTNSAYVRDVNGQNMSAVRAMLAAGRVLTFTTYIFSWKKTRLKDNPATATDDEFVGQECCYLVDGASVGHAMTIVGYNDNVWCDVNNDNEIQADELGAFKVANSWGNDWANNGFIWLSYYAVKTPNPKRPSEGALWYNTVYMIDGVGMRKNKYTLILDMSIACNNEKSISIGTSDLFANKPRNLWLPFGFLYAGGQRSVTGTFAIGLDRVITGTNKVKLWLGITSSTRKNEGVRIRRATVIGPSRSIDLVSYPVDVVNCYRYFSCVLEPLNEK